MAAKRSGKAPREYQRHGLYGAKRILQEYGLRAIDGRSTAGREIARWISDVVADLGGEDQVSTARRTIIERAAIKRLLIAGVEAYLAEMGPKALINRRNRHVYRIVTDYAKLTESLGKDLERIGLEKRKAPAQDLTAYIEERYSREEG